MCGRMSLTASDPLAAAEMIARVIPSFERKGLARWLERADYRPRYNVGPGQEHWLVRGRKRRPILDRALWGFEFSGRSKKLVFNARAETVESRPMFRAAFAHDRCLVVADGFFEWDHRGGERQPWWFRRKDGEAILLAGVRTEGHSGEGPDRPRFAIVTAPAGADIEGIHDRAPVIVEPPSVQRWLLAPPEEAVGLLGSAPAGLLRGVPVSRHVNSIAHDDPECVSPV